MKTEREIIKIIVHNEMLLSSYQEKVSQAKEGKKVDYYRDEIEFINNTLDTLYNLFE